MALRRAPLLITSKEEVSLINFVKMRVPLAQMLSNLYLTLDNILLRISCTRTSQTFREYPFLNTIISVLLKKISSPQCGLVIVEKPRILLSPESLGEDLTA